MRISWSRLALDRLLEIALFRFPDDAERVQSWVGEVVAYAGQLASFPNMGRPISPGMGQNVRRLLHKDVWIVYEVLEDHVLILTVRHVREKPEDDL